MLSDIDIPPIWLLAFLVLVWVLARLLPGLAIGFAWQGLVALVGLIIALVLMGLAIFEMAASHTPFMPRRDPRTLVTGGVFRISRNPIYLADMIILSSVMLWWGVVIALPLLWAFKQLIEKRFIIPEENNLKANFGQGYDDWARVTRRWV